MDGRPWIIYDGHTPSPYSGAGYWRQGPYDDPLPRNGRARHNHRYLHGDFHDVRPRSNSFESIKHTRANGHVRQRDANPIRHSERYGHKSDLQRSSHQPELEDADAESEEYRKKSEKDVPPLLYAVLIAKYPKLSFAIAGAFHIAFVLTTAILYAASYDILPVAFSGIPLDLEDHNTYLRAWAWDKRDEGGSVLYKAAGVDIYEMTEIGDSLQLLYEDKNNVFTGDNLASMAEFENRLLGLPGYPDFCRLDGFEGQCIKPISVLRFFDGTFGPNFNDTTFSDIPDTLGRAALVPKMNAVLQFHLARESNVNLTENIAFSKLSRSVFYFGAPLPGFKGLEDFSEQLKKIQKFQDDSMSDILNKAFDNGVGGMSFSYVSQGLYQAALDQQVVFDLGLAVGSGAFIFLFMIFQTRSLFITGLAVTSILTSFMCTNLIYRIVLDYKFIGIFHVLSVFIILGIGADDIFIYYDTWRATAHQHYPSLAHRISDCYRKASISMLITSLTTMVAFLSIAVSPLLLMSSFGIFAAILIAVNYITVVTFFPTVVAMHHTYWERWTWPCCRCCTKGKPTENTVRETTADEQHPYGGRRNRIVLFFKGPYFRFVSNRIVQIVMILLFVGVLSFLSYSASQVAPQEESVKVFKEGHYLQVARDKTDEYKPSEEDFITRVYIVWGLKNQDRSDCHKTDYLDCTGRTVWDESFDLNPKPAQMALMDFCESFRQLNDTLVDTLKIRRDFVTGLPDIKCFMEDFNGYIEDKRTTLGTGFEDLDLPLTEDKVSKFMGTRPDLYNMSSVSPLFYRYFEVALSEWLHEDYLGRQGEIHKNYFNLIGETTDDRDTQHVLNKSDYFYGTRLRYVAMTVNLTLRIGGVGYRKGIPVIEAWDSFIKDKMSRMPPSVAGGFHCTPEVNAWQWLYVQQVLANGAIQGIVIGISLAFPIITLATQNIVLGFLATLIIGCVTVSVIGVIPLAGWKLGVIESLNLSLVVGLAVDYVVHLAKGYHQAPHYDRKLRVRYMLEHVGISVLSGATSTLGASLFMLFAVVRFFMQFGIFMFSIIGFSLVYSLVLFPCVLGLIGPSGDFGSLTPIFQWIWRRWIGRRSNDVDCNRCTGTGFIAPESKLNGKPVKISQ